jgi:hypothetical protein
MRTLMLLGIAVYACAGEPAPPAVDPAQSIVAEGAFTYRQRDLDALLLVALRHSRTREFAGDGRTPALGATEEEQIRQALIRALTAREAFIAALAGLPAAVPPAARDAIALDLLAWQAEANPRAAAAVAAPPPPPATGPVIVRLPPIRIARQVEGLGQRRLTLGIALVFPDGAAAQALEAQAPVVQDAVLGALKDLGAELFGDPDHAVVKQRLGEAVRARIPGFPVDALLIPQLETGPADAPTER